MSAGPSRDGTQSPGNLSVNPSSVSGGTLGLTTPAPAAFIQQGVAPRRRDNRRLSGLWIAVNLKLDFNSYLWNYLINGN